MPRVTHGWKWRWGACSVRPPGSKGRGDRFVGQDCFTLPCFSMVLQVADAWRNMGRFLISLLPRDRIKHGPARGERRNRGRSIPCLWEGSDGLSEVWVLADIADLRWAWPPGGTWELGISSPKTGLAQNAESSRLSKEWPDYRGPDFGNFLYFSVNCFRLTGLLYNIYFYIIGYTAYITHNLTMRFCSDPLKKNGRRTPGPTSAGVLGSLAQHVPILYPQHPRRDANEHHICPRLPRPLKQWLTWFL